MIPSYKENEYQILMCVLGIPNGKEPSVKVETLR